MFRPAKFGNMFKAVSVCDNSAYGDCYDVNELMTPIISSWIGKLGEML